MNHASTPPPPAHAVALGLGGAPLGNLYAPLAEASAQALLAEALASGCCHFDTAPHYGNGLSEHRLGHALRGLDRQALQVSSKVGRLLRPDAQAPADQHGYVQVLPFVQRWDYSRAGTRRSVEDSLQRLGLARLDTAYVHDPDADNHGERAWQVLRQVIDETLPALREMQAEGLVGAIGLGVNDVSVVEAVLAETDLDALMLAGRYTLLDHTALARLLPTCTARGVRVALGGVYNSGILATGVSGPDSPRFNYGPAGAEWVDKTRRIEALCAQHGVPLRAAALQFVRAHPAVHAVIVGARSVAEWTDGLAMWQHPVPAAFWAELRAQGLVPAAAPLPGGV